MNYAEYIKAIAFDFDGTLIDFDYQATAYTRRALAQLAKKDYKICLSSGRPCFLALRSFRSVFGDCRLDYIFGCNGSEMMDVAKGETEILFPLKAAEIRQIGRLLATDYLVLGIYEGEKYLVSRLSDDKDIIAWQEARWLKPILYDFAGNDKDRSKVIVTNARKDRKREEELISSLDLRAYSCFFSSPYCFEIAPKGISKAKACEIFARQLGIDMQQILSFGDMENDMEMLRQTSGVIMDNAGDELKAQIPLHTSAVQEMGVYDFLSKNGLI